jgi:hypothetical protein
MIAITMKNIDEKSNVMAFAVQLEPISASGFALIANLAQLVAR